MNDYNKGKKIKCHYVIIEKYPCNFRMEDGEFF